MTAQDKQLIELLERWQSGDFRRSDERTLQQLLADGDEFRRDMVEGFLGTPEAAHERSLAALRSRLAERVRPPRRHRVAWRVAAAAASIALLVGAAWWLLQPRPTDVAATLPAVEPTPRVAPPSTEGSPMAAAPTAPTSVAAEPTAPKPTAPTPDKSRARMSAADAMTSQPAADVAAAPGLASGPTPQAENFENKEDRITNAARPATPPQPVAATPAEQDAAKPVPAEASKKAKAAPLPAPQPTEGWAAFEQRVAREARRTPEAVAARATGTVRMLVDLNRDGTVRRVGFINQFGYGCDEIAEQIVRRTTWKIEPNGARQIMVEVPFR